MPNFEKEIQKLFKNKEFLYVFIGSFFFFTLKIFLIYLNDTLELMAIEYAYLFCHIFLFFISWLYHSLISFGKSRRKSFVKFFETAWTLKILDYFFVILLSNFFFIIPIVSIIISSLTIFLVRFLFLKNYVFK
tara:strand:+ start:12309 stop:12707 length:399 start_codon:yes stop_codon:yes gene_type:complete